MLEKQRSDGQWVFDLGKILDETLDADEIATLMEKGGDDSHFTWQSGSSDGRAIRVTVELIRLDG